jgi:hypothetical protein
LAGKYSDQQQKISSNMNITRRIEKDPDGINRPIYQKLGRIFRSDMPLQITTGDLATISTPAMLHFCQDRELNLMETKHVTLVMVDEGYRYNAIERTLIQHLVVAHEQLVHHGKTTPTTKR